MSTILCFAKSVWESIFASVSREEDTVSLDELMT